MELCHMAHANMGEDQVALGTFSGDYPTTSGDGGDLSRNKFSEEVTLVESCEKVLKVKGETEEKQ